MLPKIGDIDDSKEPPAILTDEGWKACDGSLVSRRLNPKLYECIGCSYNDDDLRRGFFNLPDLRKK